MDVAELRELARKYTAEQIEACITSEMETGKNVCLMNPDKEGVVSELAKAGFVRELTDKGMSLADALRELARRIRFIQMKK